MAYIPEEIMMDIVLRLPVKPLFRFKSVSKRYKSIISSTTLGQTYMQRAYSSPESWLGSGLLSTLLFPLTDLVPNQNSIKDLNDVDGDSNAAVVYLSFLRNDHVPGRHTILGSNNGLILSVSHNRNQVSWISSRSYSLWVSNPLTKETHKLPIHSTPLLHPKYGLDFALATRRSSELTSAFLTYKVVIIRFPKLDFTYVEIFSSDTGRWDTVEVSLPNSIASVQSWREGFAYKGVLHWLHANNVVTYDPFDTPDRFRNIPLPEPSKTRFRSLIYSGDHELPKYCELRFNNRWKVWRLDKGEWFVEHEFVINLDIPPTSRVYCWTRLVVTPYRWNRHLICFPKLFCDNFVVMDSRLGEWKSVETRVMNKHFEDDLLIPIDLCPWSSPAYHGPVERFEYKYTCNREPIICRFLSFSK